MAEYTQDKRVGELKAPAGLESLVLRRFTASEGISELFEYRIEAVSEDKADLPLGAALGKPVTVIIDSYADKKRYFVGILAEARHLETDVEGFGYLLVVRPWLHLLSKRTNSRVFAEKTIPDIIQQLGSEHSNTIIMNTQGTYPALEYVVQHRESDLAFLLRLMEAHGMSYHFKHGDGSHEMVVTDKSRETLPGGGSRKLREVQTSVYQKEEYLTSWMPQRHFTTGKVKTNDYNFKTSTTALYGNKSSSPEFKPSDLEHYEQLYNQHMADAAIPKRGEDFAQVLLDRFRTEDKRAIASGDAVQLTPGFTMTLTDAHHLSGNYLIVRCSHHFSSENYRSGANDEAHYEGAYEMIPEAQNFVPPKVTPKPTIAGVQTGKVVGKDSNDPDIDVDEHGRILVHLHWNTEGENTPIGQTMRCRVLQSWAGSDWGTIFTPRVGMEVLVQYIDGDPDRPVVIGCVYNDKHKPPYGLPGEKNISGWKSRSTENGGADDYNEFIFDDTKGKELVRLNAQKDLKSTIEHDETRDVLNDRTSTIKHDDKLNVDNDRTTIVKHNDTKTVDNDIMIEAKHQITLKVGSSTIVMDQQSITIKAISIKVEAQADLATKGGITAEHTASGPMTIKGLPVTIN